MNKKIFIVFLICFVAGFAFAQDKNTMKKVTVDCTKAVVGKDGKSMLNGKDVTAECKKTDDKAMKADDKAMKSDDKAMKSDNKAMKSDDKAMKADSKSTKK